MRFRAAGLRLRAAGLAAVLVLRRLRDFAPGVSAFWKAVALAASVPSVDPTDSATLTSRASSLDGFWLSTVTTLFFKKLKRPAKHEHFRAAAPLSMPAIDGRS